MREPFLDFDGLRLFQGDAASVLAELPPASVDLCVTSPPFFNLRDYGTGRWEGGDAGCDHKRPPAGGPPGGGSFRATGREQRDGGQYADVCPACAAVRIDEQIGLERTLDEFVGRIVAVFREVRRVLRPHGVVLLEVGDSYSAGARGNYSGDAFRQQTKQTKGGTPTSYPARPVVEGVPGKNLYGVPWRIALALQADGWILRGDYIWSRPNPMPSSAEDRCTVAHSYVFHLTKRPYYFWDGEAIREEAVTADGPTTKTRRVRSGVDVKAGSQGAGEMSWPAAGRNARSVWTIPTEPKGMGICPVCLAYFPRNAPERHCGVEVVLHYAAFPEALAEKAIRAATSERGVCPACGKPWERLVEEGESELAANTWSPVGGSQYERSANGHVDRSTLKRVRANRTLGWEPSCACGLGPVPAVVLDPFAGSGTALLAARRLGRYAVGVELNATYCEMAARRLGDPASVGRAAEQAAEPVQLVIG